MGSILRAPCNFGMGESLVRLSVSRKHLFWKTWCLSLFESNVESYIGTANVRMGRLRNLYRINLIECESVESRATVRLWLC
jgi:hypothetical protein